jgi:hypothetical protein
MTEEVKPACQTMRKLRLPEMLAALTRPWQA